jgi:flagellar motor protein MotB
VIEDVAQVGEIRGWQIVGRTDRRNLKPQTARTYGSNEALAMARARTVRDLMIATVPQFHDDRAMVAIGGPDSYVSTSSEEAMRADRAVDIFILLDSSQELRGAPRLCLP